MKKQIYVFLNQHKSKFSFLLIGGLVAVLDPLILWILLNYGNVSLNLSVTIAYFLGAIVHFTLNNKWTFKGSEISKRSKIIRYILLVMTNYFVNLVIINVFVHFVYNSAIIAKYVAVVACMAISYTGMDKVVFTHRKI